LPKVLFDLEYSTFSIGIIFSITALMRFITPFFFLKLFTLDQSLFKKSLLFLILSLLTSYYSVYEFYQFLITSILFGISISLILPFIEAIALDKLDKSMYGRVRLFGSIGFMIVALFVARYEFGTIIILNYIVGLAIITSIFALLVSYYDEVNVKSEESNSFSIKEDYQFWISVFLMQLSFGAYYNFFTIYETDHGISIASTSYLWSIGVIAEITMLYYQGSILKKYSFLTLIKLSTILTALRWYLTYLFASNTILLYIIQTLHAFSFALYHTSVIMYLFMLHKDKRLSQQFFLGIGYGLGGAVGAVMAGELYGEYLFLYSAFFALLSYLFLIKLKL